MELTADSIKEQIPYYLTSKDKEDLVRELKNLSDKTSYYTTQYPESVLQGDGWSLLQFYDFDSGEKCSILGIILSNSCDAASENKRDIPAQVTFSPIVYLSGYVEELRKAGVDETRITQKVQAIRKQQITNIFYLPKGDKLEDEGIVLFGLVHTMPLSVFEKDSAKKKYFTLNQTGFYLFLLKLSVHFCRFQENLRRNG